MSHGPNWEVQETMQNPPIASSDVQSRRLAFTLAIPLTSIITVLLSVFYLLWFENHSRTQISNSSPTQDSSTDSSQLYHMTKPSTLWSQVRQFKSGEVVFDIDLQRLLRSMTVVGSNYEVALPEEVKSMIQQVVAESVILKRTYLAIGIAAGHAEIPAPQMIARHMLMQTLRQEFLRAGIHPRHLVLYATTMPAGSGAIDQAGKNIAQDQAWLRLVLGKRPLALEPISGSEPRP